MKLWLIRQESNRDYDTYDSAVVAAETEVDARRMHPRDGENIMIDDGLHNSWVRDASLVTVQFLGEAKKGTEKGVICASFNAG